MDRGLHYTKKCAPFISGLPVHATFATSGSFFLASHGRCGPFHLVLKFDRPAFVSGRSRLKTVSSGVPGVRPSCLSPARPNDRTTGRSARPAAYPAGTEPRGQCPTLCEWSYHSLGWIWHWWRINNRMGRGGQVNNIWNKNPDFFFPSFLSLVSTKFLLLLLFFFLFF